jgi:hypothetical protein
MYINKVAIFILFFVPLSTMGQEKRKETIASAGSSHIVYGAVTSYFVQESIGQGSVIKTFTSPTNYSVRQGFIQPISASTLYNGFEDMIDADIWPNPFTETVNISFNEPLIGPINVRVYDITGRVVYDQSLAPSQSFEFLLDQLAKGTYLLKLESQARSLTSKLIKQ